MCSVSNLSPVLSEAYEDVLAAVQESSRGRWFLEEYAKRIKGDETKSVLDSIHKLEAMVAGLPGPTATSPAVDRVKAAIEAARTELGMLKPEGKPLSEEAKMFAHLAKLSRQSFVAGAPSDVTKGLEVALKLVSDLEDSFTFAPPAKAEAAPVKPPTEQQKYFHQDADVFAPVPTGASTSVQFKTPATTKPPEDPVTRGAKLTIHRGVEQAPMEPAPGPVPANLQSVSHTPADAKPEPDKPRIVIIRRKPEDLSAVPLADQVA
jgi:hypothetical protein